jgi:hypothetical protein
MKAGSEPTRPMRTTAATEAANATGTRERRLGKPIRGTEPASNRRCCPGAARRVSSRQSWLCVEKGAGAAARACDVSRVVAAAVTQR